MNERCAAYEQFQMSCGRLRDVLWFSYSNPMTKRKRYVETLEIFFQAGMAQEILSLETYLKKLLDARSQVQVPRKSSGVRSGKQRNVETMKDGQKKKSSTCQGARQGEAQQDACLSIKKEQPFSIEVHDVSRFIYSLFWQQSVKPDHIWIKCLFKFLVPHRPPTLFLEIFEEEPYKFEGTFPKKHGLEIIELFSSVICALKSFLMHGWRMEEIVLKAFPDNDGIKMMSSAVQMRHDDGSATADNDAGAATASAKASLPEFNMIEYFVQLARIIKSGALRVDYYLFRNVHYVCKFLAEVWTRVIDFCLHINSERRNETEFLHGDRFWEWDNDKLCDHVSAYLATQRILEPYRESAALLEACKVVQSIIDKQTCQSCDELVKKTFVELTILQTSIEFQFFLERIFSDACQQLNIELTDEVKRSYIRRLRTLKYGEIVLVFNNLFRKPLFSKALDVVIKRGADLYLEVNAESRKGKITNSDFEIIYFHEVPLEVHKMKVTGDTVGMLLQFLGETSPLRPMAGDLLPCEPSDQETNRSIVFKYYQHRPLEIDLCLFFNDVNATKCLAYILTKAIGVCVYVRMGCGGQQPTRFPTRGNFWLWHATALVQEMKTIGNQARGRKLKDVQNPPFKT